MGRVVQGCIIAVRPPNVLHVIRIGMAYAVFTKALHAVLLLAPVLRPVLHVVIGRPVDATMLDEALRARSMDADELRASNEDVGAREWIAMVGHYCGSLF